jgi:hypothetical protein
MKTEWLPIRFIDQEIEVSFIHPPLLAKKPGAPDAFHWDGELFQVDEVLSSWFDVQRRGQMAKNMSPEHLRVASKRGSWGVGRYYFRVRTSQGRVFDLYYDRAPKKAADRSGHWFLWRELRKR